MFVTTKDGTQIYYKDGARVSRSCSATAGRCRPMTDTQMLFFLNHRYRVIAHNRRGHARSTQTGDGHGSVCRRPCDLKNAP